MRIGGHPRISALIVMGALAGCGAGDAPDDEGTVDVTAANATNIVDDTARKLDATIQQNSRALDAAIEAQSKGVASE